MGTAMAGSEIVVTVDPEIADMVPRFLENRAKDLETLRAAIAAGDRDAVRKTGHTLKGVGGGYGFPAISGMGERIEEAALDGRDADAREAIDDLAEFLVRVRVEVGEAP
jgi:HPt (histidine-containing phosphotransfer) domain-containing protein